MQKNDELSIDDGNVLDISNQSKGDDNLACAEETLGAWHLYEHYEDGILSGGSDMEFTEMESI